MRHGHPCLEHGLPELALGLVAKNPPIAAMSEANTKRVGIMGEVRSEATIGKLFVMYEGGICVRSEATS